MTSRTYDNPVIGGFHPDPSVCRVGEDYSFDDGLPSSGGVYGSCWRATSGTQVARIDRLSGKVLEGRFPAWPDTGLQYLEARPPGHRRPSPATTSRTGPRRGGDRPRTARRRIRHPAGPGRHPVTVLPQPQRAPCEPARARPRPADRRPRG